MRVEKISYNIWCTFMALDITNNTICCMSILICIEYIALLLKFLLTTQLKPL